MRNTLDFDWVLKMKIYFKDGGFLVEGINEIPESAVEVPQDLYAEVLAGQANGQAIDIDENGLPCLIPQVHIQTILHQREEILFQLKQIDDKKIRAITDVVLTGDKTFLEKLEEDAVNLRAKLKSLEF